MSSCTSSIIADLQNTDTFKSWMDNTNTNIQKLVSLTNPTVDDVNNIKFKIQPDIQLHQNCISESALSAATIATDVSKSQDFLHGLNATIKQREKDVKITHDRATVARNPEITRGYYDGWFSINRPFKHFTIPLLIAISIFLISLSLFFLLNLFGIDLQFVVPIPVVREGPWQSYGSRSIFTSKPFLIMTGISVILLGLTIYGFTRKV